MTRSISRRSPLALALLPLLLGACFEEHAAEVGIGMPHAIPAATGALATPLALELPEDAELEPWRLELIELAMDSAGAIPAYPHLKTQAQMQQHVVEVCIRLDQPRRALSYADRIGNWRRGVGYAGLAEWLSEQGREAGFDALVALAEEESRLEGEENPQNWQRDTIRSMLASALFRLGRAGDAAAFEHDLDDAEVARLAATKASLLDVEDVRARLAELDAILPAANLDQVRGALAGAIELYERGIEDPKLRQECESWIGRATQKVPAQIRLEVRLEMARKAAARGNESAARAQVDAAREVLDAIQWLPEDGVPLTAHVAEARFAAGDAEKARAELAQALDLFHARRESIQDFWRGAALRPVAEACVRMGDDAAALRVYRLAAEEGSGNPNARTRCEDLVANCLSMALHGVRPDAELSARLRSTREGLVEPW